MKVVVFGASGQVGRALLAMVPASWQVFAPSRREVDFVNKASICSYLLLHRPRLIINCAAYTQVDMAESEPQLCQSINVDACRVLALSAAELDAVVIQLSTDYVFDGTLDRPYREDDATAPLSVYGHSKRAGELALIHHCPRHLILRTSWVFDAVGHNFVSSMLSLARERHMIAVVDDQIGGPTPAAAIAEAVIVMGMHALTGDCFWGIYHFSGQPNVSWYQFAQAIFEDAEALGILERKPRLNAISSRDYGAIAARPLNSRLDNSEIYSTFAIEPPDWRRALRADLLSRARNQAPRAHT